MGRTNTGPRYFASKGGYYVTVGGVRHLLAKGKKDDPAVKKAAETAYHNLMLASGAAAGELDDQPCFFLFEAYIEWFRANRAETTTEHRTLRVQQFVDRFGKVKTAQLTRKHAYDHLAAYPGWSSTTKYAAVASLLAALNWGVQQGRLSRNPLAGLERPRQESRVKRRDAFITDEVHAVLLEHAEPWRRDYLEVLDMTGARPGELAKSRAEDWRPVMGALQPTGGKGEFQEAAFGRKRRTVYVPDSARPILDRLLRERQQGLLFVNGGGGRISAQVMSNWLAGLKKKGLVPKPVCTVLYRHRFITRMLLAGVPVAKVAAIVGNSAAVIEKNYNHLDLYGGELKAVVDRFASQSRNRPGGGRKPPRTPKGR